MEFKISETLEILEAMPAKECIMLLDGKHYLTGADYSEEYLSKSLGSLVKEHKQVNKYKSLNHFHHYGDSVMNDKIFCDR